MRKTSLIVVALLTLASAAPSVAASWNVVDESFMASVGPCEPDAGPFDPCLWQCNFIPTFCTIFGAVLIIGGAVWRCVVGGPPC